MIGVDRDPDALAEAGARLLKDGRAADPAWLTVLEQRMAEQGVAIAVARRIVAERMRGGGFHAPRPPDVDLGRLQAVDLLQERLHEDRRADVGGGITDPATGQMLSLRCEAPF